MTDIPAGPNTKAVLEGDSGAGTFSGQLESAGDHDWIKVNLSSGLTYKLYLCFLNTGSVVDGDSTLRVHDASGAELAFNDDRVFSSFGNSGLTFVAPSTGTFFVDVGEYQDNNAGAYSLVVLNFFGNDKELTDNADAYTGLTDERVLGGKGNDTIGLGSGGRQALGEQATTSSWATTCRMSSSGASGATRSPAQAVRTFSSATPARTLSTEATISTESSGGQARTA
jgi:hypothetical protein